MSKLREAKAVIEDEGHWTRGALARGADGRSLTDDVDAIHAAKSWCAVGALIKAHEVTQAQWVRHKYEANTQPSANVNVLMRQAFGEEFGEDIEQLTTTSNALFNREVYEVNDSLDFGHEAVMQVFEKAIVETEGSL